LEDKKLEKEDFILESSQVRESGPMLKEHLGNEYEITSIFKHNEHLTNVAEDVGKLGNNLTKSDHIIIVGETGNSLGRYYHYSNEKDINFIAERSDNTNFKFANLFWFGVKFSFLMYD
jgi:hypothetical protein